MSVKKYNTYKKRNFIISSKVYQKKYLKLPLYLILLVKTMQSGDEQKE